MDSPWVPGDGTPICLECTQLLNAGVDAVRRHSAVASQAVDVARSNPTDEKRRENRAVFAASFQEAQSAWDAYRKHLIEHGILPASDRF